MSAEQPEPARPALREGEIELCGEAQPLGPPVPSCVLLIPDVCSHRSDPPLGKFPPMTFSHPVLYNASARWRSGGGTAGLVALLKCAHAFAYLRGAAHGPARRTIADAPWCRPPTPRRDGSNLKAFRTLVRFTFAMFGVPALTMTAAYFALPSLVGEQSHAHRMTAAGIAALCSVQLVIVAYVIFAFTEAQPPPTEEKKDA
jgi:hypothetical protein